LKKVNIGEDMKIAIIGRSEILYDTATLLLSENHEIPLIITSKEAPEYTKTSNDFEVLSKNICANFLQTSQIDSPECLSVIKNSGEIDIAVSINYSSVLSQSVTDLFPLGILNAHGGDLPRYRGNACQAWAILNGEEKVGLCIHKMIGDEIDSGDIVAREYLDIDVNTKVTECWSWMKDRVPNLFLSSIQKLQRDSKYVLEVQSTNKKEVLRCYPRVPEDGKIDWSKSNDEILKLINATNKPYGGAFCSYLGKKTIIWDAELTRESEECLAVPGQISSFRADGSIIVICGNGWLRLNTIEYEGVVCSPKDIIKGIRKRLL
jgi:methionyl-tRNA formyltransferase